jgi:hypothetical protein
MKIVVVPSNFEGCVRIEIYCVKPYEFAIRLGTGGYMLLEKLMDF